MATISEYFVAEVWYERQVGHYETVIGRIDAFDIVACILWWVL